MTHEVLKAAGKWGGARRGAGRKPILPKKLAEMQVLANQLNLILKSGLVKVGDSYIDLVELSIRVAKGEYSDGKPDKQMLTFLLEFLPRMIGPGAEEEDAPFARLLKEIRADNVTIQQINQYGSLETNISKDTGRTRGEGVTILGTSVLLDGKD